MRTVTSSQGFISNNGLDRSDIAHKGRQQNNRNDKGNMTATREHKQFNTIQSLYKRNLPEAEEERADLKALEGVVADVRQTLCKNPVHRRKRRK